MNKRLKGRHSRLLSRHCWRNGAIARCCCVLLAVVGPRMAPASVAAKAAAFVPAGAGAGAGAGRATRISPKEQYSNNVDPHGGRNRAPLGGRTTAVAAPTSGRSRRPSCASRMGTVLFLAADPDLASSDPFRVLGIDPTADPKEIKRAYKRLALRYHPDVSMDDKKTASERFARINWAYQVLTGRESASSSSSSASSASASNSASSSAWTPPHRRSSPASSSSASSSSSYARSTTSTDWRDYLPRDEDDEKYDASGDSFGAIFRDLVAGAAATASSVGGRGIFRDFVDFLEQTVDGYGSSSGGDDADLRVLLQVGTLDEVAEEMDTTELVVQQLAEKQRNLERELAVVSADAKIAAKYMEKLQLEERVAELEARKRIVEGYTQKARKRLLALQTAYKQRIVQGENDPLAGGRAPFADPNRSSSTSPNYSSSWRDTAPATPPSQSTASSPGATATRPRHERPEDAWKDDSFGSFGRGRGSSRRRQQRTAPHHRDYSSRAGPSSSSAASRNETPSGRPPVSPPPMSRTVNDPSEPVVPPHRRTSSFAEEVGDKRRLRELKVDDEFDKLKRELGL